MTLQGGGGLLKQSKYSTVIWMGGRIWPNRHTTSMVTEKAYLQFLLLYFRYMWGRGWLKTTRLAENVTIASWEKGV